MIRRHKRNRRKRTDRPMVPGRVAAILAAVTVFSLAYLSLGGRCEVLGNRIKALERQKAEVRRLVVNEEYKLSNLKSPRNIEALLKKFNLAMTWPQPDRVIRLRGRAQGPEPVRVLADGGRYVEHAGTVVHD